MTLLWSEIERWANDKLATARNLNDDIRLTEVQTAVIRGRIACLKELLVLPAHKGADARAPDDAPV